MTLIDPLMDELVQHIDVTKLIKTRDEFSPGDSEDPPDLPLFFRADYLHIDGLFDPDNLGTVRWTLENQLVLFCHGHSDAESWIVAASGMSIPNLVKRMQEYEPVNAVVSCNPAGYRIPEVIHTGKGVYYGGRYIDSEGKLHLMVMNNTQGREVGRIHLTSEASNQYFGEPF